jgi:hypothetical protein
LEGQAWIFRSKEKKKRRNKRPPTLHQRSVSHIHHTGRKRRPKQIKWHSGVIVLTIEVSNIYCPKAFLFFFFMKIPHCLKNQKIMIKNHCRMTNEPLWSSFWKIDYTGKRVIIMQQKTSNIKKTLDHNCFFLFSRAMKWFYCIKIIIKRLIWS